MPLSPDMAKIRQHMIDQYGKVKGNTMFYKWINKHGLDETKPMKGQPSKASEDASPLMELFDAPEEEPEAEAKAENINLPDNLDRRPDKTMEADADDFGEMDKFDKPDQQKAPQDLGQKDGDIAPVEATAKEQTTKERNDLEDEKFAYPEERKLPINDAAHVRNALARWNQTDIPADKKSAVLGRICSAAKKFGIESDLCKNKSKAEAGANTSHIVFPQYKFNYVATPKFGSKDGPVIIKALVLEEGANVNGWRVVADEFPKVAEQFKAGNHLRVNHSKDVQDVIGKSFDGKVLKGSEVELYMGKKIDGIQPDQSYVAAEFEANPRDQQVRTNILAGYVETGSIGLEADAQCDECGKPVMMNPEGDMQRECSHVNAPVKLSNVVSKEYSYVAEPAFGHSIATPTFAAAVSSSLSGNHGIGSQMSSTVQAKADSKPQKPEDDGDQQDDADAQAAKYISYFNKGVKAGQDMMRVQAKSEGDSEADASAAFPKPGVGASADAESEGKSDADADAAFPKGPAKASKTDQKTVVGSRKAEPTGVDLIAKVTQPSKYAFQADNGMKAIFAEIIGPNAVGNVPNDLKAKLRSVLA